ncbi:MAG TPA: hypothetical protein VGR64_09715, partial [Terracidiphilus sp.]|nr:hypothetical protein [Terracidiphilus sp.]
MEVAVIPVAVGQAGVSVSANSGVSTPSATGIDAGIVPRGTAAAGGGSAPQQWQQCLRQSGVRQTDSAADGQSGKAGPSPNAQQITGATQPVANTFPLSKVASTQDGAMTASSGANQENSNLPSTSRAAQDKTKNAEPTQKKDGTVSASAQNLLASLLLPAAVTASPPLVPASTLAKAPPDANGLASMADPAVAAALLDEHATGSTVVVDSTALRHGQGIAAPVQTGISSGIQMIDLPPSSGAVATGKAASTDTTTSFTPEPFSLNALHAHVADTAQSATGNGAAAISETAKNLAHALDVNASQGANAAQAASQAPDANAASPNSSRSGPGSVSAHAERNRDANLSASLVPSAQNAFHPVQLSALPVQPVAAAHSGVPGNPGSPTLEVAPASGAHAANPFATLDSGAPAGPATWVHAATHSAEAGFQDPSLGWVG